MDMRLDATMAQPVPALRNNLRPLRRCCECGEHFEARTQDAAFCCTEHRKDWNNRRAERGAQIYDLLMALRFDRKAANLGKVWTLVSRLCSTFRQEDHRDRAGRLSWRPPAEIIARRPSLKAERLVAGRRPH